jgi:hypothetical protein
MRKLINLFESSADFISRADRLISSDHIELNLTQKSARAVHIDNISSTPQKAGWGTKAMTMLCTLADEMGIILMLEVETGESEWDDEEDSAPSDEHDLVEWYYRFGFEIEWSLTTRVQMVRQPKSINP